MTGLIILAMIMGIAIGVFMRNLFELQEEKRLRREIEMRLRKYSE